MRGLRLPAGTIETFQPLTSQQGGRSCLSVGSVPSFRRKLKGLTIQEKVALLSGAGPRTTKETTKESPAIGSSSITMSDGTPSFSYYELEKLRSVLDLMRPRCCPKPNRARFFHMEKERKKATYRLHSRGGGTHIRVVLPEEKS